jgi:CRP-like cAMP-binding protein
MVLVLSGSARVQQDGHTPDVAAAGDVIGVATALGGQPASMRVEGISEGAAIYFTRAEMFELLADHIDLLQAIYSGLLKAQTRLAVV